MPSLNSIDLGQVAATVTVGTTTTGAAGSSASVTNSGTTANAVFDFTIPEGASGCYPTVTHTATAGVASATIVPQTVNIFGDVTSLSIALDTPVSGIYNEYIFNFNSGSTATTLSVPADVAWTAPVTIGTNKHYEVNIVYDDTNEVYYGIIVGWDWTAPSEQEK